MAGNVSSPQPVTGCVAGIHWAGSAFSSPSAVGRLESGDMGGRPVDLTLSGTTAEVCSAAVEASGWLDAAKDKTSTV